MTEGQSEVSLSAASRVWARVALQSFGGPAGQIGVIHRLVVDERGWVSESRFLHALSYCMMLPGPEAQQLTTYLGWRLHGVRGGLIAGTLFIVPGFVSILALSVLYAEFRNLGWVAGLFFGLKPAVLAVVVEAVLRLRRRALTRRSSLVIAACAFVAIFAFGVPFPLIVLAAAAAGVLVERWSAPYEEVPDPVEAGSTFLPPWKRSARTALLWLAIWLVPVVALRLALGPGHVFVTQGVFFSKAAVVTFGGAYAVLSYVAQQAVEVYEWLAPNEMLDGLGMAETTPGPLIQVVQFVGFMGAFRHPGALDPVVAGVIGSVVTTWVTFVPCFLFVFLGAPYVEFLRKHEPLNAALRGVTAAVVGVVVNLAAWFALHTLFREVAQMELGPIRLAIPRLASLDWRALAIALGALVAMLGFRLGMIRTLIGAAAAGVLLWRLG